MSRVPQNVPSLGLRLPSGGGAERWPRAAARPGGAWLAWWLPALVWALVLVPMLGRMHQSVHWSAHGVAHVAAYRAGGSPWATPPGRADSGEAVQKPAAQGAAAADGFMPAHAAGLDCLLLDQLALADVLLPPSLGLPLQQAAHATPSLWAEPLHALHAAVFQARAPPLQRA